jgi:hypothetical protein
MLEEEVDPSGEINSVVLVSDGYFLEKFVSALENFGNFVSLGPILCRLAVSFDILEWFIQDENNFNQKFGHACLNQNLLNGRVGGIT